MANLLSDIRFCLRGFARRPMFAFVVVATLALGLSINAAIFSIYDQVLLRELRVPAAADLVNFQSPGRKQGSTSCSNIGNCDEVFSYPMFRDLERFDGPFVGIAAHRDVEANLAIDGKTIAGNGLLVSGKYFSVLGLRPAIGRLLDSSDDRVDGEASAAVLSYAYWQSGFAGNPAVVGRELVVNGKTLTIVGVVPSGFTSTTKKGLPVTHTSDLVWTVDEAQCRTVNGTTNGTVGERGLTVTYDELSRCGGWTCPSGSIDLVSARGLTASIDFDGSSTAIVTGPRGREWDVPLFCKEN